MRKTIQNTDTLDFITNYNSYVKNNYGSYINRIERSINKDDAWTKTALDKYNFFNTLTFKDRVNRYTGEKNIKPTLDLVTQGMTWANNFYAKYMSPQDKVLTVLEKGSDTNRLHLHQLIKIDEETKEKNNSESWIYKFNRNWFGGRGNFGAYKLVKINNRLEQVSCCNYVTKVNSYIHKNEGKDLDDNRFFPHIWRNTLSTSRAGALENEPISRFKTKVKNKLNNYPLEE